MASVETVATELHVDEDVQFSTSSLQSYCDATPLLLESCYNMDRSIQESTDQPLVASSVPVCTYCNKLFRDKSDLNRHIRTHTGEKPFVCPKCYAAFTRQDSLRKHVSVKHGIDLNKNND